MASLHISRPPLFPRSAPPRRRRLPSLRCRLPDAGTDSNGDEPPESLFKKELKRRGMTPTSLLEDSGRAEIDLEEDMEESVGSKQKWSGVVWTEYEKGLDNQRERSMALNSGGLEGLIPRAKLLLTIGGTFFLGFWPFILITTTFFTALYFYFGTSFVHNGLPASPPPYIDPYVLLEDERISQIAPQMK